MEHSVGSVNSNNSGLVSGYESVMLKGPHSGCTRDQDYFHDTKYMWLGMSF